MSDQLNSRSTLTLGLLLLCPCTVALQAQETPLSPLAQRDALLELSGVKGGLVVHLGCGAGHLTLAFGMNPAFRVHGLDTNPGAIRAARSLIQSQGRYGPVSVDRFDGRHLPYIDNLVNLVVVDKAPDVRAREVMRVLAPGGTACIRTEEGWTQQVKAWPQSIDEWTHYLHDATGNAVAQDTVIGPPRRLQWIGGPRWGRHHDHMSSVSAVVSAQGRIFTIADEASRISILLPPQWKLVARDAFNGTVLWKRPIAQWFDHLHRLKSGPAELPRRLVAYKDRVYVTLGIQAPLTALDAATGEVLHTYEGTAGTEEVLLDDQLLLLRVTDAPARSTTPPVADVPSRLTALDPQSGQLRWDVSYPMVKLALAMDRQNVVFLSKDRLICLNKSKGDLKWQSEPVSRAKLFPNRSAPTLVLYQDVVLFAGNEIGAGGNEIGADGNRISERGNRSWYMGQPDTLTALSAQDGRRLWQAPLPLSGYASPKDVLVSQDVVWLGETTSGHAKGHFTGRNVHTGDIVAEFDPDVDTYWFHHRCYRAKATERFLLTSRTGTEFIDIESKHWDINHWVRGACLYGLMPANGLLYAPQNPCACVPETKMPGLTALAPAGQRTDYREQQAEDRLERGRAYGRIQNPKSEIENQGDWPTYRHDNARSGRASTSVPVQLAEAWKIRLPGPLSAPVIGAQRVLVASKDTHTLFALDASSGKKRWHYTAGGRIDSPPTVWGNAVLFGSRDGYVHCLEASRGILVWRFRAAPLDRRMMALGQLESIWPVHGSVLVQDDPSLGQPVLYFVAGRSMFLDGGMRLFRMDPLTGEVLSDTRLDDKAPETDKTLQDYMRQHNMPVALSDILSYANEHIYMRSQAFGLDGKRVPLQALDYAGNPERYSIPVTQQPEHAHLFCPTGFLDDSGWHRSYWIYGSRFLGGWAGYPQAGKVTPAGRILAFDDSKVYGFGRKPQYYRWTTPIEHQLFCAAKDAAPVKPAKTKLPRGYKVAQVWTQDVPLFARALVLTEDTLFVAGPADLIDENEIRKRLDTPKAQAQLKEQASAYTGANGAILWAASSRDGQKQAQINLQEMPVFDGMAAAYGKLFLSTVNGTVQCLGKQ